MLILTKIVVLAGMFILVGSLLPVGRLIGELPAGRMRARWYVLTILIFAFIGGYMAYTLFVNEYTGIADLVVPAVFFFGACFVLLVNILSLQTAKDIKRVAVLEQENVRDSLTEMYNRRFLDRRLEEEVGRAHRYDLPLSLLMLDLDHFKRVNDTYGHQVGDSVLVNLGAIALKAVRQTDVVARYGGEEVAIVAIHTDNSSATLLAERIRRSVESFPILPSEVIDADQDVHAITVSIGVACLGEEVKTAKQLVAAADEALYQAKQEGRNRVVLYSEPELAAV